jgi:hypothetical protein
LGEKPKAIPKKIREINEDLKFEKIRRTGTRKLAIPSPTDKEDIGGTPHKNNDIIEEDMKEFLEEQKKRIAQTGGSNNPYEEADDDDYFDNDAELGYDDYNEAEEQPNIDEQNTNQATDKITVGVSPAKPILKTPLENSSPIFQSAPRKSVRFSLRPGSIPVPKGIDSNESTTSNKSPTNSPSNKNAGIKNSAQQISPNSTPTKGEKSKRTRGNIERSGQADCDDRALLMVAAKGVLDGFSLLEYGAVPPESELRLTDII